MSSDDAIPAELLDPQWRLSNLYQIRTKIEGEEGQDVMYEPNEVQGTILSVIEVGWKRVIILKPRKLGVTTAISVFLLDKTLFSLNQICRTIAHRRETAADLFSDIAQHALTRLKETAPGLILFKQLAASTRELAFNNGSAYSIDVEARGKTPTILHGTEVAYFEDEKKWEDSLESLPKGALGIFESTANGRGNWFERNFMKNWNLLQQGARPEIYPLFFAWFDDPNNTLQWTQETVLYYPEECAEQKARFSLADDQILWWDRKRYSLGARLPELYPSTPEEAFIFSTGKVYGEEFREELNVIPVMNLSPYRLSMDYGQTNPLCILKIHRDHDDNFIVTNEFYRTNAPLAEVRKWLEIHCADRIKRDGYIEIEYADPSVFNDTQVQNIVMKAGQMPREHRYSIADEFQRNHKIILRRGTQNDIATGIVRVKGQLKFDPARKHPFRRDTFGNPLQGSPRLFITSNCVMLRREFDLYRWPKDPGGALTQHSYEVPLKKDDHAMDALRYAILTWTQGEADNPDPPPPPNTLAYHLQIVRQIEVLEGRVYGDSASYSTY